jgi:hypothetical protein
MFQRNKSPPSVGLKNKLSNKQQVASSAYTLTPKWQAEKKKLLLVSAVIPQIIYLQLPMFNVWQFDTERVCDFGRTQWLCLNQRCPLRCEHEARYTPKYTGHTLLPRGAGDSFCLFLVSVFWSSLLSVGETTGCPSGEYNTSVRVGNLESHISPTKQCGNLHCEIYLNIIISITNLNHLKWLKNSCHIYVHYL